MRDQRARPFVHALFQHKAKYSKQNDPNLSRAQRNSRRGGVAPFIAFPLQAQRFLSSGREIVRICFLLI